MIFYSGETISAALVAALKDETWTKFEKNALERIAEYVAICEQIDYEMTTEEWLNNPTDFDARYPADVSRSDWTTGTLYHTHTGLKFLVEPAGTGYRIGRCNLDYLTTTEAAEKWEVVPATIRLWSRDGKIPGAVKAGRDWLIPIDAKRPKDGRLVEKPVRNRRKKKSL